MAAPFLLAPVAEPHSQLPSAQLLHLLELGDALRRARNLCQVAAALAGVLPGLAPVTSGWLVIDGRAFSLIRARPPRALPAGMSSLAGSAPAEPYLIPAGGNVLLRMLFPRARAEILVVPLWSANAPAGAICLQGDPRAGIDASVLPWLRLLAAQCAPVVAALAASAHRRRHAIWSRLLAQLAWRLRRGGDAQSIVATAAEVLGNALRADVSHGAELPDHNCAGHPLNLDGLPDYWYVAQEGHARLVLPFDCDGVTAGGLLVDRCSAGFASDEVAFARLAAAQVRLAIQVAQSYTDVRDAYTTLAALHNAAIESTRLRTLGLLAAGIAHDFNNLLTAILGRAQLLEMDALPSQVEDLRVIQRAVETGAASIRRIQLFARPQPSQRTFLDLSAVASDALSFSRSEWAGRVRHSGVSIAVVDQLIPLPPTIGDAQLLREVFLNLILNAIDAMPDGGMLTLASGFDETSVWVAVADTGVGIPADQHEAIFEPFVTTKAGGGHGLGLAMARQTVRSHEGVIRVCSTPGQGTTMTVLLPRALEEPAVEPAADLAPSPARRVLVVEDDALVGSTLVHLLKGDGHAATAAADAVVARRLLDQDHFDVVIADEGLPGERGSSLLAYVRVVQPWCATALISGWDVGDDQAPNPGGAIDMVIAKPVNLVTLRKIVR